MNAGNFWRGFICGLMVFQATAFLVSPASARSIVVKVEKLQNFDITFMSVRGGAVTGLPKGQEPQKFDINVTLPDGKCTVSLRVVFGNNTRTEVPINFCSPDPIIQIGTPKATPRPAPPANIQGECDVILSNANTSKAAMSDAGSLYYHGMRYGKKCVKVDYVRAFDLLRKSGDSMTFNGLLKDLKVRAAAGNPTAINALAKIDLSPM